MHNARGELVQVQEYEGLVDRDGDPTASYAAVQKINAQLRALSPVLAGLYFHGATSAHPLAANELIAMADADLEFGFFGNRQQQTHVLIANRWTWKRRRVVLGVKKDAARDAATGAALVIEDQTVAVELAAGGFRLLARGGWLTNASCGFSPPANSRQVVLHTASAYFGANFYILFAKGRPMSSRNGFIEAHIYDYILANSLRDRDELKRLRQETRAMPMGGMQISPDQGQFMGLLVELIDAKRIVEVGTFTGYSSTVLALALPADGHLIACDVSDEFTRIAGVIGKKPAWPTRSNCGWDQP